MSYPKGEKSAPSRSCRSKKRKFHGNQHSDKRDTSSDLDSSCSNATARKLATADCSDISSSPLLAYRIIEFFKNTNNAYCPDGADSWCKWKKAEATGADASKIKHPAALQPGVQKHLLPIYEDLLRDDLLHRCLGSHTQNANENFNSTVWRLAPKNSHSSIKIVEISAHIAGVFNEGLTTVLKIMNAMEIIVGRQSLEYMQLNNF